MTYRLILLLIAFTTAFQSLSQQRSYAVHVGAFPVHFEESLEKGLQLLNTDPMVSYQGKMYCIIQLEEIPDEATKYEMSNHGIHLLHYVPNYAWIAKVNDDIDITTLNNFNVRRIRKVSPSWKVPKEMMLGNVPDYAGDLQSMKVRVLFLENDSSENNKAILASVGVRIDEYKNNHTELEMSHTQALQLADHPFVQYIEWTDAPIIEEGLLDEAERAVSTYISDNPGKGYYFNGSGVKVGVDESGIVDSLQDPNFRSRLNRDYESGGVSGHKTWVSLRVGGAGNINPKERGVAFGADVFSGGISTTNGPVYDLKILNRSYGWGCPSGATTYSSSTFAYDQIVRLNPEFIITHSAGNVGGSDCYAGSAGWGNITGISKMAKNVFIIGSTGSDGTLTGFSSRGPSKDGRILPHVVAPGGGGTSHASPNLAGAYAQLNQAYQSHYGVVPSSGLLKAVIMNTADEIENPGPDFKTGYGSLNVRRAYEVIKDNLIISSSISQGQSNQHTIDVPAGVKKLKVLVYWIDWEATAGITTKALVNDLDMVVTNPGGMTSFPWILNPVFDSITLNDPAIQGVDTLNNAEQITIDNPVAGQYTISIDGTIVPQGPQEYFITYELIKDEIIVTHPHGGERFVPLENERLRWDTNDDLGTFNISYSEDGGANWDTIVTAVNATSRYYDWTVPETISDSVLVKIERGSTIGVSDTTFSIYEQPENLELIWTCADSSLFYWDHLTSADGYIVYRIVGDYMDSVAYTNSNSIILNGLSVTENEYVSIAAVKNNVVSRRIIAITRPPVDENCIMNNIASVSIINPGDQNLPDCMLNNPLTVRLQNVGVNTLDSIPVAYTINGMPPVEDTVYAQIGTGSYFNFEFSIPPTFQTGLNTIAIWTQLPSDQDLLNDTTSIQLNVYNSTSTTGSVIAENFDSFTNCSTAWGCEADVCSLTNGWLNVPNLAGDDIDWRTDDNGTGTGGTGPSGDHTSGSGKYLYLEGSGNGGSGCSYSTAKLHSPCIYLHAGAQAELSFWYHAFGGGIGELHVDVIADGVLFEDVMHPIIGQQGDMWLEAVADLSPFENKTIVVVIRGSTGGGFHSDLAIDDINISIAPTAAFDAMDDELCEGQTTILNNTSFQADTYEWSIAPNTYSYVGGTNANSVQPELSFSDSGYYTVQLIATNSVTSDSLLITDHIYVWGTAPLLTGGPDFCEGDSVIIFANNNGEHVEYYLNNQLQFAGTDSAHYFVGANQNDSIYTAYPVNAGCVLYSDTVVVSYYDVDVSVNQNGITLTANASNAESYQWIDCEQGNTSINGETGQEFTPTVNGEYAVVIEQNGCLDTSSCFVINSIGLDELHNSSISIYPIPSNGEITIRLNENQVMEHVEIWDITGKKVYVDDQPGSKVVDGELEFVLDLNPGKYQVVIRTLDGAYVLPILIQR